MICQIVLHASLYKASHHWQGQNWNHLSLMLVSHLFNKIKIFLHLKYWRLATFFFWYSKVLPKWTNPFSSKPINCFLMCSQFREIKLCVYEYIIVYVSTYTIIFSITITQLSSNIWQQIKNNLCLIIVVQFSDA